MKALKYVLIGLAAVALVLVAGAAYFAATFDPNAYKPQLVALVKDKTGRTLTLEGDIALSFWPSIGAKVGRMTLSEPDGKARFAAVEQARVSLRLLPLLSGRYVVDELAVKGLRATVVKEKAGNTNIDDIVGKPGAKKPEAEETRGKLDFDIAHVEVDDAAVEYRDEATGATYALAGLTLKSGRLAPDVPTKIDLKTAVRSTKPALDMTVAAAGRLTFNLERKAYGLEGLALDASGRAAGYTDVAVKASGNVSTNMTSGEFSADKLIASASGMQGKNRIEGKLDAPKLAMTAARASGENVSLALTTSAADGTTSVRASLPAIEGTSKNFRSPSATIDVERKQPERTITSKIASPLTGSIEAKQLALPQLKASIAISGGKLPPLAGELTGKASVDGAKSRAQADLAGKLADSGVKARVAVAAFSPLALEFDVDMDRLDVVRLTGEKPATKASGGSPAPAQGAKPPTAAQAETPLDLSALRELRANGRLRVGELVTSTLKASNLRVDLKASNGRVDLNPLAATLYQGTLAGATTIDASGKVPAFSVRQTLTGVQVGPLLRELAHTDTLEGKGNVSVDVTTRGDTTAALKKALAGKASVKITDGAVKGIDVAGTIRKGEAMIANLKGQPMQQQSDARQRTDFSELSATFDIRDGVARNDDLSVKSPLLRIGGAGQVNIGADTLDYTVKASLVASTEGQGGKARSDLRGITVPVRVSGPLASPAYRVDFAAMVTEGARQKVEEAVSRELERRLGGGKQKDDASQGGRRGVEDALRGLFRK